MTDIKTGIASESGHWYDSTGQPAYEVPDKKGNLRPVTLRDARKLNLFPSVTTVLNIMAKPGLETWKQRQILMAALTLPQMPGETLDDFAERCIADGKEQARKAADLGTQVHASIEAWFSGDPVPQEHMPFVAASTNEVQRYGQDWTAERSFANSLGFGGKIDLSGPQAVIDFKTKEFGEGTPPAKLAYPEMLWQLSAYGIGLGLPGDAKHVNVFISTTVPGLAVSHEWTTEDVLAGRKVFLAALKLWQSVKGYIPR